MSVRRFLLPLLALGLLLAACGGQPDSVSWRNLTFDVPDGWYVFEETDTRLSLSNADIGPEAIRSAEDAPEGDVVALFLTYEPGASADAWRTYVEQQEGTLEEDESFQLGEGVPANRLVFEYVTGGIPMREMIVVIPSRDVVALAQPVPRLGQEDGPDVFLDYRATFDAVIESVVFGPPPDA